MFTESALLVGPAGADATDTYSPRNYYRRYFGITTLRKALEASYNGTYDRLGFADMTVVGADADTGGLGTQAPQVYTDIGDVVASTIRGDAPDFHRVCNRVKGRIEEFKLVRHAEIRRTMIVASRMVYMLSGSE